MMKDLMNNTISIRTQCPDCKKVTNIEVTNEGYRKRQSGALVQVAFPELDRVQREMLITGICGECWDKMFSLDDE